MVASEHACYSSVLSYQSKLLLLGLKAVHVVTIKTWKEVCMSLCVPYACLAKNRLKIIILKTYYIELLCMYFIWT